MKIDVTEEDTRAGLLTGATGEEIVEHAIHRELDRLGVPREGAHGQGHEGDYRDRGAARVQLHHAVGQGVDRRTVEDGLRTVAGVLRAIEAVTLLIKGRLIRRLVGQCVPAIS